RLVLPVFAALAAALAILFWARVHPGSPRPPRHFSTDGTAYQRATLPDGSVLVLNANTRVDLAFASSARRLRLLRGDAHFTVASNPNQPFIVTVRSVNVRALGTAFSVRAAPTAVEVLVTAGQVQVEAAPATTSVSSPPLLQAGQKLTLENER